MHSSLIFKELVLKLQNSMNDEFAYKKKLLLLLTLILQQQEFHFILTFLVFDLMMLDVHFEAVHIIIITVNFRGPL